MGFLGFQYKVVGFKDTPTGSTQGAIQDAGPFLIYCNSEIQANKILGTNANAETGGGWDYTASANGEFADVVDEYSGTSLLTGSVTLNGVTFKNVLGKSGNFQQFFHVYGHENKNCSRISCTGKIQKIIISNRSSFYCGKCQV